jgi:ribosomal protein L40E
MTKKTLFWICRRCGAPNAARLPGCRRCRARGRLPRPLPPELLWAGALR